jgi:predicted RNA-binding Zn ribbon-like protein
MKQPDNVSNQVGSAPFPVLGQALPIELANTRFFRGGEVREGLATVRDARTFVRLNKPAFDVPTSGIDEKGRRALVEMRELVREVLTALSEERPPKPVALRSLNAAAARRPARLELRWPRRGRPFAERRPARRLDPTEALRAAVAEATILFVESMDAARLRACPAPGCIGFFVPQHGRQEWCSIACGNRARNARFHQRHRP